MSPSARRASAWRAAAGPSTTIALERVAEHRGDGALGAGVDLEVVDERADDAGQVAQRGRGVAVAGLVERGGERLGACLPTRDLGVGVAQQRLRRAVVRVARPGSTASRAVDGRVATRRQARR